MKSGNKNRKVSTVASVVAGLSLVAAPFSMADIDELSDAARSASEAAQQEAEEELQSLPEMVDEYRELQDHLIEERRSLIEQFRDAPPEERRAAVQQFQQDNAELLARQRDLNISIREFVPEEIDEPDNPSGGPPGNVDPPGHGGENPARDLAQAFKEERQNLIKERRELMQDLSNASREERQAALQEFRATQRELIDEWREEIKENREKHLENIRDRNQNRGRGNN